MPESWALPLSGREHRGGPVHTALRSQVCKVKAISVGFCMTKISTERFMILLKEASMIQRQTTAFVSHQLTSNSCGINSETYTFSLYMNVTHAPELLEEDNNPKCVLFKPAN